MIDAVARRRSKYKFARQDSQLSQDRYSVSDESADFGSQAATMKKRKEQADEITKRPKEAPAEMQQSLL